MDKLQNALFTALDLERSKAAKLDKQLSELFEKMHTYDGERQEYLYLTDDRADVKAAMDVLEAVLDDAGLRDEYEAHRE